MSAPNSEKACHEALTKGNRNRIGVDTDIATQKKRIDATGPSRVIQRRTTSVPAATPPTIPIAVAIPMAVQFCAGVVANIRVASPVTQQRYPQTAPLSHKSNKRRL